jgi:isoleucyl-tRNA synthetase
VPCEPRFTHPFILIAAFVMTESSTPDYKNSVLLPATGLPMRAGLPKREPEIMQSWEDMDLFGRLRSDSKGRETYILHDGPPYANGAIHIGHALNKVLKDLIVRTRQMQGYNAHYVPGWDCHGLPIEWKVEEKYRAENKEKDDVPVVDFRQECRAFAEHWIGVQIPQFKRLGVMGDWDKPYKTMSFDAEGQIVRELGKFVLNGGLYRGSKPVLWSVVEKTALADAEVEYADHKSVTIWVRFKVVSAPKAPELEGSAVVIWTTTPWTMPANRAVAFNETLSYGRYQIDAVAEGGRAEVGEVLILADDLADEVMKLSKVEAFTRLGDAAVHEGMVMRHPLSNLAEAEGGYDFDVPMLMGDYVTAEAGTGFVHIAPGHGLEDYELAHLKHGMEVPMTVSEDGSYYPHVPLFAGLTVYDQKGKMGSHLGPVIKALDESGGLLHKGSQLHSYPHSWRSKAPLIYRNTPQWFISMETNALRAKALKAIDETTFFPSQGKTRLRSMIEARPDWCVSRQRVWGVPLPIFMHKVTFEPLRDEAVIERIAKAFDEEGGDAWFTRDPQDFLGPDYDLADYEQVQDVVEVWFDSGSTHAFVLENRPELSWPADLYLEGTDQHRGWFHTSLLESAGTRGRAPYKAVLTHGFTMDEQGRKMSKSLGNGVDPLEVADQYGIDILRLWVISTDFTADQRIGKAILQAQADAYRRLRNTLRFTLGNLADYEVRHAVAAADMPELERWVLHRLKQLDTLMRSASEQHEYNRIYNALINFCGVELSAFYFDIRKDVLYCDARASLNRRATQTVLAEVFSCLTAWLAPFTVFTAEEAWQQRKADEAEQGLGSSLAAEESVHLRQWPELPQAWLAPDLAAKWEQIRQIRRVITGALEIQRKDKTIGSSLEAAPRVYLSAERFAVAKDEAWDDIAITSQISLLQDEAPEGAFVLDDVAGVAVVFAKAEDARCERCWKHEPDVGSVAAHPSVCGRCASAYDANAADAAA